MLLRTLQQVLPLTAPQAARLPQRLPAPPLHPALRLAHWPVLLARLQPLATETQAVPPACTRRTGGLSCKGYVGGAGAPPRLECSTVAAAWRWARSRCIAPGCAREKWLGLLLIASKGISFSLSPGASGTPRHTHLLHGKGLGRAGSRCPC
jgi:hypothetical protein